MTPATVLRVNRPINAAAWRRSRGFTLIELLVVIAVLAILISILLPAFGKARGAAWQIVGANNQRQFMVGMGSYASDSDGWFPGINTSGLFLAGVAGAPTASEIQSMDVNAALPVQSYDWMSPALDPDSLPNDREARFYTLLERFADPAMRERSPVFFGSGGDGGSTDAGGSEMQMYITSTGRQPARGISYLMPLFFQLHGFDSISRGVGAAARRTRIGQSLFSITTQQATLPNHAKPSQDGLKNPNTKLAIADGFRYWTPTGVDFDASYKPGFYGSFCSGGAVYNGDISYGTTRTQGGLQLPLSYRHAGRMNAMFWDGHGAVISRKESFNPTLWYPSGSLFSGTTANSAAECFEYYRTGDTIH